MSKRLTDFDYTDKFAWEFDEDLHAVDKDGVPVFDPTTGYYVILDLESHPENAGLADVLPEADESADLFDDEEEDPDAEYIAIETTKDSQGNETYRDLDGTVRLA